MTEKPPFDPSQPFEAGTDKPPFDPSKPFEAAPDLAGVGATAQTDLVQQPGALDAKNTADLASLVRVPGKDSFTEALKGAVYGNSTQAPSVTPDPARLQTSDGVTGVLPYIPRGVRRGVATVAGLPVDLVNMIMGAAGAPVSSTPVGGKESIDKYILRAGGLIPDLAEPDTAGKRITNRVSEEIGAAVVPVGGAIAKAGQVGLQGARELPPLTRMFVEPAAINPSKYAAKEMGTAAAAGAGAAGAGEISHAAGFKEGSTPYNVLDFIGALTGAGAMGATRMVAKPLNDVRQAIFSRDKFSNNTVKENVTDRIINNSDTLPKVEGQPVDTQPLVDAITRGHRVDATIPGFKESIADRTGDPGLAALEYGRQSGSGAGAFTARRAENTAAVDTEMNRNAPNGNPADLRAELELERTRRQTDAGVQTRNATDSFERATQALQPAMTGEGRGANIRAALEHASTDARNILEQAWEPINRSGAHVDMAPLADDFGRVRDGLSTAESRRFQPPEAGIPRELSGQAPVEPPRMDAAGNPVTEAITQPINEVTGLRSALTDAAREARTAGRDNEARIIGQHIDALDNYLDNAVTPELRADYDRARAATVDYHDRFSRPPTAVAQTLDRNQGVYRQPDSAVAGKFVQADEGRVADFQALMRETGHDHRTVSAVRDQILADVRDRGLLDRPDQLADYLGRYNTVLSDQRFAATRGQLDNAAGLRRSLNEATERQTNLTKELGTPDTPGTSTVGKYLQYGDERAQDALKGVIASKKPGEAMDEMLNFVGNDPKAVAGAKKSFWDLMQSKSRSNGETTKGTDGAQPWMPNRLQNFLDDPAHQAIAERLYRDNPEQLGNVRKIAEELQNVDLRARSKAPNTTGTAQGISNVLTPETLQSRFYAYKRGQTSLGFMLTALGSVAARRLVRGAQGEAMEKLLDKALLDPDLAAQLLKEHNPANRAALARTAKAYLGNEASTLTGIIEGDGSPADPVKDAIMKKDEDRK